MATCKYCERPAKFVKSGLCYTHHTQVRTTGQIKDIRPRRVREDFIRANEIKCVDCGEWKENKHYRFRKERQSYETQCLSCRNIYKRLNNFKLDKRTFSVMLAEGCNACGSKEDLHIDHDHACCPGSTATCGKCVRGVLCHQCNTALGLLGDSIVRINKLRDYLAEANKR